MKNSLMPKHGYKFHRSTIALICAVLIGSSLLAGCIPYDRPAVTQKIIGGQNLRDGLPARDEVTYYDTIEEVVANNTLSEGYARSIDEIVILFEGDDYATLFFQSVAPLRDIDALFIYNFYVKRDGDKTRYSGAFGGMCVPLVDHKESITRLKVDEFGEVRVCFNLYNFGRLDGTDDTKRFYWGLSLTPRIKNLKVDGQTVTEVIPVDFDGETAYFWHFEDLQSDKPAVFQDVRYHSEGEMSITMDAK